MRACSSDRSRSVRLCCIDLSGYSPFLVRVLQVRGSEAQLEFTHTFGVVDSSGKHLGQVRGESAETLGQVGVKALAEDDKSARLKKKKKKAASLASEWRFSTSQWYLVKEGHVDEAVVENQGSLGPQQFCEQSPDVDAPVIRTSLMTTNSREEETINERKREVQTEPKVGSSALDNKTQLPGVLSPCCCP